MAFERNEPDLAKVAQAFGPGAADRQLREAIMVCWMMLPPERKSIDHVEEEIRRLLERIFRDLREDEKRLHVS